MTPAIDPQLGLLLGTSITAIASLGTALLAIFGKKIWGASDQNESVKLGNEFLRGLLNDARTEREELRKTIDDLRADAKSHEEAIARLQSILNSKDARIRQLETLLEALTDKLRRGEAITLADLLATDPAATAA